MYIERQNRRECVYFYLVENIRIGDKWKKIRVYLGKDISKKMFDKVKKSKEVKLKDLVKKERRATDQLFSLINSKQEEIIRKVSISHKYKKNKADEYQYRNYYESFVTEFTYDTNAIEGSTITLQ